MGTLRGIVRAAAFALLVVAITAPASALDPERPLSLYLLDVWRDGLPQYTVQTLAQTQDSCLWFGTFEGLVRFNGLHFEVFDPQNTPALTSGRIRSLLAARNGVLWIGTAGGGVVRFVDGTFTPLAVAKTINTLIQTRDGAVWIGSDQGIHRFRDGHLATYATHSAVLSLAEDASGALWVGTEQGLLRFDRSTFTQIALPGTSAPSITAILPALDGTLWIGTQKDGLFRRAPGSGFASLFAEVPALFIAHLLEDSKSTIWIGASPGGVVRFRDGRYETLTKEQGLPNSTVRALLEDREGNLWAGTNGGLARLSDRKFITYGARNGLTEDNVRVVVESPTGALWVGTYGGGVNLIEGDRVTATFGPDQGVDAYVRTMALDSNGTLWAGTSQGLVRIQDGKATVFGRQNGLTSDRVDSLLLLRDGTLLSGGGSLQMLRDQTFVPYLTQGENPREVRAMLEGPRGELWLATPDGVVQVRDRKVVRTWTTRDGLPGNTVFAFLADPNGDLWIGTHEGLARLRNGTIARITTQNGLPWDVVFQIVDDGRGHFWLTSNRGLARVDRASISALLDGKQKSIRALRFGKADGMGSDQCNGATQPAGIRLRNGRLAIPTVAGLTIVDPANLHLNRVPPAIVLREVLANGRKLDPRHPLVLPWATRRMEFRYDGISLLAPELVRFRYRIDNLDPGWIDAGTSRVAFYNPLPPGRHVFHVAAINNDGVWSAGNASFAFELPAPPWQRWWALVLYGLVVITAITLAIRYRERAARLRTELLEARVHERTIDLERAEARAVEASRAKSVFLANMSHELRTPLNAVIGIAQLIARSNALSPTDRENVGIIRRSGEHLLSLINDVLSMSKIESGKLSLQVRPFDVRAMLEALASMMRGRAEAAGLTLIVDSGEEGRESFPPLVTGDEGKLRQVLLNLLGNAVKFTTKGTVTIQARWADGRATFAIRDTGPGIEEHELPGLFDPFVQATSGRESKEGTGLGLAITKQLIELMNGRIDVKSRVGEGTTVYFGIDLPAAAIPAEAAIRRGRVVAIDPPSPRRRIAVVDDNQDNRTALRALLQLIGFDVREATNGLEAIDLWASWKPELIFMDQRMPEMDGSAATRAIRTREAQPGAHQSIIIALTASVFEHERDALLANGADGFVMKPFDEETIFESLEKHIGVVFVREDQAADSRASKRILVVDDSDLNRQFVGAALENLGFAMVEASNGMEALERLDDASLAFDAVLLDIEMPELDGRETVKRIRAKERWHDLPVIALTAHDADEVSLIEGMTDFVTKPIDEQQLAAVFQRHGV